MVKLLFLEVPHRATVILFQYFFANIFDPYLMEGLSHYIKFSKPFPSYICSSSNLALKYVSYRAFSLALCERQWLKTLFRGLLYINADRKTAAVHLMHWWQVFPKIFPVSLSPPYTPEVYFHCWNLLKDYPSHPNACLTDIRQVRGR